MKRLLFPLIFLCMATTTFAASAADQALFDQAKGADVETSIKLYNQLIRDYPQSALADDAFLNIAKIRHDSLHDDVKARRALEALLERYPKGDAVPEAKRFLDVILSETKDPVPQVSPRDSSPKAQNDKQADDKSHEPSWFSRDAKMTLQKITPHVSGQVATITLEFDHEPAFTSEVVPYGPRTQALPQLILDIPQARCADTLERRLTIDSPLVSKVTLKRRLLSNGIEIRLTLARNAHHRIQVDGSRVVIFVSTDEERVKEKASPPKEKSKPLTIVIDPGHGGDDQGAIGKRGTKEKDVALAIAKKLAKELKTKTGAKIYLTRTKDQTLTLDERAQFGEQKKADLFLSVHANASTSHKLSGIQTFYLNNATDQAAAKLALRENRSAGRPVSEVDHILSAMTQTAATDESRLLADDVQAAMVKRLSQQYPGVNDLHVHGALFYVLTGAKCPSILVETSFLSNPREERRLANTTYQQHLVGAIVAGVQRYVATKDKRLQSL